MTPTLTLKIGHRTFTVVPLIASTENVGMIDFQAQTIALCYKISPQEQARVLIHELLHAAYDMTGSALDAMNEEDTCQALDGPLATIFADNPQLFGALRLALNHGLAIVGDTAAKAPQQDCQMPEWVAPRDGHPMPQYTV